MNYEIVRPNPTPGRVRLALFDFDGTVSLLRSGWDRIMIEFMTEVLPRVNGERSSDLTGIAGELVHSTNGQPTLFQMRALSDLVRERGGAALPAPSYKQLYLERLRREVEPRKEEIRSGTVNADVWQMRGVGRMLEALEARGIRCYLASGSDQAAVREEIAVLALDRFFNRVYGATSDARASSKAALFQRLQGEHSLKPNELVTFGDGVEEIRLAKEGEGIAVGIARDEKNPDRIDPVQRERLVAMGADVIISDFREHDRLMEYLFGGKE